MKLAILQKKNPLLNSEEASSAVALGEALGAMVMSPDKLLKLGVVPQFILNWGLPCFSYPEGSHVLNHPLSTIVASNKLLTLNTLLPNQYLVEGEERINIPCVDYTTNKDLVRHWLSNGNKVVVRKLLRASQGKGIEVISEGDEVPTAPLYTKYVKHRVEFRVHIIGDGTTLIQRKVRLTSESMNLRGITNRDMHIRNIDNGYIYSTNLTRNQETRAVNSNKLIEVATDAVRLLGLDFGAVDLIVPIKYAKRADPFIDCGDPLVLEINTAPGLGCTESLEAYVSGISQIIDQKISMQDVYDSSR